MADSSNSSKTPSAKARQAARQEGRIALSGDLATAISLIGSFVIAYLFSPKIFQAATDMMRLHLGSTSMRVGEFADDAIAPTLNLVSVVGQCLLAITVFVAIAWVVQTGALFATSRITPDVSRINPAIGLLRLFSIANVVTALLNLLKIAIVGGASYLYVRANFETLVIVGQAPVTTLAHEAGTLLYHLALACTGSLIAIGVVDYAIKRARYEASLSVIDDDSGSSVRSISNDPSSSRRRATRGWVHVDNESPAPSEIV
jgi:flagellar biosynthesis protein FlhB